MPQTVTIAQALQSTQSGLTVQDTAANIAQALPNAALVSRVTLFELSGAATVGTAAADQFAALGGKFSAGYPIAVQDTVAAMTAAANTAGLALASSRGIVDAAYNLLAAAPSAFNGISSVTLTGTPTLSAAQLTKLEGLPGFTFAAGGHFSFSDTLTAAAPVLAAHPGWFAAAASGVTLKLDGSQVSAGVATTLAALANAGRTISFTPGAGDTTLNITAAAHDLAAAASSLNRVGQIVPLHITVSNDGSAISAADAVALTTINGFAPSQHTLTVADTGAAITAVAASLFNHGYPQIAVTSGVFRGIAAQLLDPTLRVMAGATVSMTGTPVLNAAQAQILASLPGFSLAAGATLTVSDTIAHILAHAGAMTPATAIALTDSETVNAAGLTTLAQIAAAHAGHFGLSGHTISVADNAANLVALGASAIALGAGFALTANGNVSAAQFGALRDGLHVAGNGFHLTVSDSAANLLALSGNLALVTSTQLSANANVTAAQAQVLAGEPGFSAGGHTLTVTDNAAALLALPVGVQALAGQMVLAGSQSVTASQAAGLATLSGFSTGGAALTVTDTAANLLSLPSGVAAIAGGYALSANANVSAAQFATLEGTLQAAANGHAVTVTDSAANLLGIPAPMLGQAGAFLLSGDATVSAAQFGALRDTLQVGLNAHVLTVSDTAANLLALSGSLALAGATQLSADANVSAAQAQALAEEPGFGTGGHVLTITDAAAALLALPPGVQALAGQMVLAGSQSVSAAQVTALAALGGAFSTGGATLTVTDTAANLLGLPSGVSAIAGGYALSADATVSAAQFTTLTVTLNAGANGHALTVADTAANLVGISGQALGQASGFLLSADATVSAAQFATLRDTLGLGTNGHSLTISDTAANLLALPGSLALAGATQLSADANVTAAQAQALAAEPGFGTGGHALTITDTAAALLALPAGVQGLAAQLVLSGSQSVTAAQAAALAALGAAFSLGGAGLTVTDTASNLLALPAGAASLAGGYALSADAAVSAAQFNALTGTLHVALNGHAMTVTDTAANLLTIPGAAIGQTSAVLLSANAAVSAAQFTTLRDTIHATANGYSLTVSDTAANLLGLSGNLALVGATQLSADASVTAAQAQALAAEPGFGTGGHALTISDSAAALLALPGSVAGLASHLVLASDQTVTAAQAGALLGFGSVFSAGGHVLTVSDTPAHLLAMPQLAGQVSGFSLSAGGTVTEAQFALLRDTYGVAANGQTLTVADTAAALLALSGNLALDGATQLTADATVTVAQAQSLVADPAFSTGGHALTIADTAVNLLAMPAQVLAQASAVALSANATVTEAQFMTLRGSFAVQGNGHTLIVADSAANLLALSGNLALVSAATLTGSANVSAAQAAALTALPGFATGGQVLTVTDSAANLLALPAGVQTLSGHLVLAANQSVTAAQITALAALGTAFSTGGHVLTVTDTAASLLGLSAGAMALAGGTALSANATLSAAQFTTLEGTMQAALNGHTLAVSDTPAALLGIAAPLLAHASGFSLSAGGTVNAAQFTTLRDGLGVSGNGNTLTLADSAATLLALSGSLALAGATQLTANATVSAAQAQALAAEPGFGTGGHVLIVSDSAANLLGLSAGVQALSGHLVLAGSQSVTAAQATALAALGGAFSTGGAVLTVTDTATALLALPAGADALAGAMALSANATVTAAQFAALEGTLHAALNGHTLIVADTPAALMAVPGALLGQATGFALSAGGTVTQAQFVTLRDTLGVAANGQTLTVADTAANLLALSGSLALVGATQLSANATVTAAQAQTLAGEPGFALGGHVLTVSDSAANLLALPTGVQTLSGHLVLAASQSVSAAQATALAALGSAFSVGGAVLTVTDTATALLALSASADALAGAMVLSANATVSAAQFATLEGTLHAALGGHTLVVQDTPANLLAIAGALLGQATGFALSAGGTVTQAQFVTLRDTLGVAANGQTLTVADTAANLLALSGNLTLVGATQLSANATVGAAQAQTLTGEPGFGLGGHVLTVSDTAANLLALPGNVQTLSGHLVLGASQSVSAAQITALAALGSAFSAGGNTLTVSDTAANLLSLSSAANALAGAFALSADANVTAAQFTTLYATLHVALTGHALVVADTATNLLTLPNTALPYATGFALAANGAVNESQFLWLRDTAHVAGNGHTLTVTDSAANLLALSGGLALIGATQLSADATVSAAQAQTLAGEPGFAVNNHVLTISDTAANLLALPTSVQTLSGHLVLSASQSVNAAQASGLAALGSAFATGGNVLTVTDTAANLLSLPAGVAGIAGAYALSANATVNAAGFITLYNTLHVVLNGHAITVADTPANLLTVPTQAIPEASFMLTTSGTVSEAQFITLRDTFGVGGNGNTLTVSDTASGLLALSGSLALDGATQLSANASVSAAQAVTLASDPGFAVSGHVLTITDTAANLLALPTSVQALSGHLVLSAAQSVNAAQATSLAALGGVFSTGGNTLTVTDTAANLLALPSGVAGIAGAYALSADATVNAAQFGTLRDTLHVAVNGHALTILDTAPNLAALTGSMASAYACVLSANGTVSAAGAAVLNAEPNFSNAGHTLTIADTVANLLALSTPLQNLANAFTLSANQVASATQLAGLAAYGIKFGNGGYTLGVVDNAANLAALTSPQLALVNSETMSASATISAATAATLAGLSGFALGSGVVMTVQDSATNLLTLPSSVLALASTIILPAGAVSLSAAQAAGLHALTHFSTAGATVTVTDSVAALNANSGWSSVATYTHVVDSAATLAGNAATALLQNATSVTLTGNATVTATQAAALATIGGYSTGTATLTVADGGAAIAANEAAIASVATGAVVNTTASVTATQADALALLSTAGKLSFQAGDAMTVADSYAALTAGGNATGLALASNIMVNDTAVNLVAAAAHNWGNVVPTYVLTANATITGAQATTLANLGSHLLVNGHTLAVQDSVANVIANASALTVLGISATVSDSAANVGGNASSLQGMGSHLAAVQLTDSSAVTPAVAAALSPLASKLTGAALAVAGSASAVDGNISALTALGAHVAIAVTDSAAAVSSYESDLAGLGTALTVTLNNVSAVTAAIAAGVAPLTARFAVGTSLAVTDTMANIVSQASALGTMGVALGTLTLNGGTAASVVQAVALLPLQSHLGSGVQLAITGNAAAITANSTALATLRGDSRVASLTDSGESASTVLAAATTLNALGAVVNVSDTLANFNGNVGSLAGLTGLAAVTITDTATPTFSLSLSQYSSEASVLALLTNTHTIAITDTAAAIAADLASGSSILTGITGALTIAVTGGATLVLSQAVATTPAVAAVLADFSGNLQVTGVNVAHVNAVAALSPSSIVMSDSTSAITADLASGSSAILAHLSAITSISAVGGGSISLTASQALAAGVDNGAGSVFGKLSGAGLVVTGSTVAQVSSLLAATVAPSSISVNDTAAHITAALINSSSAIMTSAGTILSLHVSDGNAIVLTEAQDVAAGVNDSSSAALAKVSGGAVDVTGVTAAQLATVEGGARVPDQISLSDTGANIAGALSTLLADRLNLGPITVSSGSVVLTVAQAVTAHVADGAGSLVSLLPSNAYGVSGATVAQISTVMGLAQTPTSIAVSDSSNCVAADLAAVTSQIAAHATSVSVTGGTLTLTDAQAHGLVTNGHSAALGLLGTGQVVDVTAVPVSDIGTFSALHGNLGSGVTLRLEVTDTASALATDLALGGGSLLTTDAAYVHSVTLTGAGGTLTPTQLTSVAGISGLNANGFTVPVSGTASGVAGLGAAARTLAGTQVTVNDTAANVGSVIGTLQTNYTGHLTITLSNAATITQTAAAFTSNLATIDAITNSACIVVTGGTSAIATIEPTLATDTHVSAVQVTDSAANIVSYLSVIAPLGNALTVTVTDTGTIAAPLAQALVNQNLAHLVINSLVVADTGAQIAAMAESGSADVTFLTTNGASLTANSNVGLVDAQALSGLGSSLAKNSHSINVWDTAAHLTASGAASSLSSLTGSGFVSGIYLKTTGGTVTLTAANALALLGISGLSINNPDGSVNTITVADTAAHLDASLASLQSHSSSIAAFVINASATVNGTTLSDMQTLGATTASGVSLTMSDTAANIITAAGVTGASVQASAWNLSANASVSSANAVTLAALPNFSAAGHTLTVALANNTAVGSVAQANQLGALGSALVVTGHVYTISGSVSSLNGLNAAGAAVAHVALSDTFSNLSGLSSSSPLLTGTIAVTDSESLTASQAQSFLALLTAAGVASGNVSFTGSETVTDTVANLQALTSSTAWTGTNALHSHFTLVANDTAAVLDNAANASYLNTLSSQVLSATATVSASAATVLHGLSNFSLGGNSLIVSDSASNLLSSANSTGLGLATTIHLSGAASLNAAQAEQLLQISHFSLTQTLNVTDSSANLLDGTLSGLIAGKSQVHVALAGTETLDAQTAAALVALQGFSDTTDMNIVDSSSYLLASGASSAESMAVSVALAGDETVSANTILRLSQIPHFIATGGTLTLAGNDYANAPTLKAIADLGTHFSEGGHSLSLTQDDLGLTPTEYAAIVADGYVSNSHVISAELVGATVTDVSNTMSVSATGVSGATVNVYDHGGTLLSSTTESSAGFTVTAPDGGSGNNFSITETVGGVESAPVVVLNASTLEGLVSGASASFSNSGQIQVGTGEYLNLYTAGATLPNAPALVYDPTAHTISLDIPSNAPVVLVTLGASTHPASIDPTEILVKHHS